MMLLAIDTATPQVSVALWGDDGPIGSSRTSEGRRHGERLAPAIQALLDGSGRHAHELTAVAVDVGPGLFTGLRVGLATAKALVSALGLPAVGCTSLEILAHPHRRQPALVAAVVDARRSEVFWALYRPVGGRLVEVAPPAVLTPAALAEQLAAIAANATATAMSTATAATTATATTAGVLAVGDGARRYADVLAGPGIEVGGPAEAHPDADVLAELAAARLAAGDVTDAAGLRPRYLREADVRIGWTSRPEPAAPATGGSRG